MKLFSSFGEMLTIWDVSFRLLVVVLIGSAIGVDREIKNRPAGMRTHVLVGVGAALIAIIEQQSIGQVLALGMSSVVRVSVGRITSTVVSGVGFLGAGTIVLSDHRVSGLTTAASLWCMACIGLAVGYGYAAIAVLTGAIVLIVLRLLQRIVHVHTLKKLEVKFIHRAQTLPYLHDYFENMQVRILDVNFSAESLPEGNLYTNLYTVSIPSRTSYVEIISTLSEQENIRSVRTRAL